MHTGEERSLELINNCAVPQRVFMEPWGEELEMAANSHWTVKATMMDNCDFTVCFHPEGLAVHASTDAAVKVYSKPDEKLVWELRGNRDEGTS